MELINKKYKILNTLEENQKTSLYLVEDIINNKIQKLTMINSDYLSKNLIRFLIKKFNNLSNVNNSNIIQVFNLDLVKYIDDKKVNYKQYYYTSEYTEKYEKVSEIISQLKYDEVIDTFIHICKGINYLHLRGMTYEEINLENIYACVKDEQYNIKLKDLVSIYIDKDYLKGEIKGGIIFKAPEILEGKEYTTASDIYSLGVLLYILFTLKYKKNINLQENIYSVIEKNTKNRVITDIDFNLEKKIINIIKKTVSIKPNDRYKNILELINSLNKILNKEYKAHDKKEIEKLNFNTSLIDRDYELKEIITLYKSMKDKHSENKLVLIHGESGMGKTKILKEVERMLNLDGANIYSSFIRKGKNKELSKIIKKMILECNESMLSTYEPEFVKFIPEIGKNKNIIPSEPLPGGNEKLRIFKVVENFLKECLKDKMTIIILDNIHRLKKSYVEFLQYIYNSKLSENLIIVASYNDEALFDKNFLEFTEKVNLKSNTINMVLKGLSFEGTIELIKNIMSISKYPLKFSKKVYVQTYGNPLFIEETMRNFFLNNIIYVNENTGKWESDYEGHYEKLPIPYSIEQACLNQINKIEAESYFILEFISIFNSGVSREVIEKFMKKDGLNYHEIINDLVIKGILCEKIEDFGFVYDLCSKNLKNLVYKNIKIEDKKEMHKEAASILEDEFEKNMESIEHREKIIYHLEKSYQNDRAAKYCIENSEEMLSLRNRIEAVKYLEKALFLLEEDKYFEKIKLLIKISDLYIDVANYNLAEKTLKNAMKIIPKLQNKNYNIDVLNRLSSLYLIKNKINMAIKTIRKVMDQLNYVNYKKGFIDSRIILAKIYFIREKYNRVICICNEGIEKCEDDYFEPKAILSNILGNTNKELNNIDIALKNYGYSYIYSEKINYNKGILKAYGNLAIIYQEYYEITDIAEEYLLKVKEICDNNKFIKYEVLSLLKLGENYIIRFQYEKSLNIFMKCLKIAKSINDKKSILYSLIYISSIYIKFSDYDKAYKYYVLSEKYFKNYKEKNKDRDIVEYYRIKGEILLNLGFLKESQYNTQKALEIYGGKESILKLKSQIKLIFVKLLSKEEFFPIWKYNESIKKLSGKYKDSSNSINAVYDGCIVLYKAGYIKESFELFYSFRQNTCEDLNERIKIKQMYLIMVFNYEKNNLRFLNKILEMSQSLNDKNIECDLCYRIGEYYYLNEKYDIASYNYFKSCEIISSIIDQLPEQIGLRFFQFNKLIKPFLKIIYIKRFYCDGKNIKEIEKEEIHVNNVQQLKNILKFKDSIDILKNKTIMNFVRNMYNKIYLTSVYDEKEVLANLTYDSVKNLEIIIKYLSWITLSTEGKIIIEENDEKLITVASLDGKNIEIEDEKIIKRVKKTQKPFFVFNDKNKFTENYYNIVPKDKKAVICIPVILFKDNKFLHGIDKRKNTIKNYNINGYIYISSYRTINNFNNNTLRECMELVPITYYIIDKYQLTISSSIDKLTGTYTRKYLEEKINETIEEAYVTGEIFSILMIDLDHFKNINDSFGHQVGDKVLSEVCRIVMDNLRVGDICGRYGGEEFIVVLPNLDKNNALRVAKRIKDSVEKNKILGEDNSVTISIGIASYPDQAQLKKELIEKADQALYVAKDMGRNRCEVWKKEFGEKCKSTSRLTGIITGNVSQDSRNVLAMVELIDIMEQNIKKEEKIYKILRQIIGISECQYANLLIINNNNVVKNYGRKRLEENWSYAYSYNEKIVDKVISEKQGICSMDWNETFNGDLLTVLPEWYSVMVIPITNKENIRLILYLAASAKVKKFSYDELNLINTLGKIIRDI